MLAPTVKLGEVVAKRPGTRNPSKTPSESFAYVDVAAVDNTRKAIVGAKELLGSEAPSRARQVIRAGDVLVSTVRPNLNAVALVPGNLDNQIASTGFCVLRATAQVLPEYLFYFVRSPFFINRLSALVAGAMYPAVTDSQVLDQTLPLPPMEEQRRIVDLLSRTEGIVRLRREAEQKAAELIPALFIDTFGDPAMNPKGWPMVPFGEVITGGPKNGLYKHSSLYGEGTPILRIDGFYDGRITDLSSLRRVQTTEDERKSFGLKPRDIVINRVNSPEYLGKSTIVPDLAENTVFESNMMRLSVDEARVLPEYIIQLLQTGYTKSHFLSKAKHAINQSSINQSDVKSLEIPLVPLSLQYDFVRQVESMHSIQAQQSAATAKAQAAFDALLHQFFGVTS